MKQPLWAPWRMQYILSPKNGDCCVFCDAVRADIDQLRDRRVLVVTQRCTILLNSYPFSAGHLLIVPNSHVDDVGRLSEEESSDLWEITRQTCARLRRAVDAQGLNVGMNLGGAAGAGIADHVHMHVVPRWQGDTNFMPVLADVHVMPQHLDDTWRRLYPLFADIPGRRAPGP
jgi:ATP adenylyltransferase